MGMGLHGGFGNSRGSRLIKKSAKKGKLSSIKASYTRDSLIRELDGHTNTSTELAKRIRIGDIHINVLGDDLFERYTGSDKDTLAVAIGKNLYLRRSSASIVSDMVHEGKHALDYISGINTYEIQTWPGEIRAYKAEREFQIKTKRPVDFINENDLLVHVWKNYKREV